MVSVRVFVENLVILSTILIVVSCNLSGDLPEHSCVCVTEDAGVTRKAGYQYSIVRYLLSGTCVKTAGGIIDIYGNSWYSLNVDSHIYWCSGDYLSNGTIINDICSPAYNG